MSLKKKKATKKVFRRLMMDSPKPYQPATQIFPPISNTDYKRPTESGKPRENLIYNGKPRENIISNAIKYNQKIKQASVSTSIPKSDPKIKDKEASIKVFEMRPSTEGTTLEDYNLTLNQNNIEEIPGKGLVASTPHHKLLNKRKSSINKMSSVWNVTDKLQNLNLSSEIVKPAKRVSINLPDECDTEEIKDRRSRNFTGLVASTPHHKSVRKNKFSSNEMSSVWKISDKLQTVNLSRKIIKPVKRVSIKLPSDSNKTEDRESRDFTGLVASTPHHKSVRKNKFSSNEMSSVWKISDKLQTVNFSRKIIKPVKGVSIILPSNSNKTEDRESRDFTGLIASTPHHKLVNKRKFSLNEMSPVWNVSDQLQTARNCLNEEETDDSVETAENVYRLKVMKEAELPNYMKYEAPPLPTFDAHLNSDEYMDVDDGPNWQHGAVSRPVAASISYMPNETKRLFSATLEIVDLQNIFPTIHPSNLKRTSASAVWSSGAD